MPTMQHVLTRGDDDTETVVTVTYTFHRACAGSRDGLTGPPIEPDEPAHCEIESIDGPDGKPFDVTKKELQEIERECLEDAWERSQPPEREMGER